MFVCSVLEFLSVLLVFVVFPDRRTQAISVHL